MMEDMIEFDDVLLDNTVLRLPAQYDASGFLESCSPNHQYRILASICANESRSTFNLRRQEKQHEGQHTENVHGSPREDDSLSGVPVIYYAARLVAFSTTREERTAPLALLRYAREQRQAAEEREKEEAENEAKRRDQIETDHASAEQEEKQETPQGPEEEYYYDEEGGYYYDRYGYYDADGAYYLFDTGEAAGNGDDKENQNAEEEPVLEADEVANSQHGEDHDDLATKEDATDEKKSVGNEDGPWISDDPFAAETHGDAPNLTEDEVEKEDSPTTEDLWYRNRPSEGEWSRTPFMGGVQAVHRAAAFLENSLPSVDAFLREIGIEPNIPVCRLETECKNYNDSKNDYYETHSGAGEKCGDTFEASGLYVLASRQHLHIVYVPNSRDETDQQIEISNAPSHATSGGLLLSVPLPDTTSPPLDAETSPYLFTRESVGDGLVTLDISAAAAATSSSDSEARHVIVSLVFGVSPDPRVLFRASPMSPRLTDFFMSRVTDHLDQRIYPLRYSPALLCRRAGDAELAASVAYDAATHSWLHAHELAEAARAARAVDEALFLRRRAESPRLAALREALAAAAGAEGAARESVRRDEAAAAARLFALVRAARAVLAKGGAAAAAIAEAEAEAFGELRERGEEERRRIAAEETRRRLNAQFDFERRLRAVECDAGRDVLFAQETAGRAIVERDEAMAMGDTQIAECVVRLRAEALVAAARESMKERETGSVKEIAEDSPGRTPHEQRTVRQQSQNNVLAPTTDEFMRVVSGLASGEKLGLGQSMNSRKGGRTLDGKNSSTSVRGHQQYGRINFE